MKKALFILLLFVGCAASQPTPREFLEQCAKIENYSIETNGTMYRLLWPNGDVAGYFETLEEAQRERDSYVWNAMLVIWRLEGTWEVVK